MIDTALLNGLWQGALIVALTMLVITFVPRRDATTRYALWFCALFALAIVPVISLWHPQFADVGVPAPLQVTAEPAVVTAKAANAFGTWLAALWLVGVVAGLVRLALSFLRIRRIVRSATPAPQLGQRVVLSDDLSFPIAAGMNSPSIVVPAGLATSLERSDLDAIVRHEAAHIARHDVAGNMIQRLIEAALFFNPWVYVIGRQLVQERESACDDWVVHATRDPDRYASCLARLAQAPRAARVPLLTPSAIGSRRMLVGRIERLLAGRAPQLKVNTLVIGAVVVAFAVLAAVLVISNARPPFHQNAIATTTTGSTATSKARANSCGLADSPATVINAVPPTFTGPATRRLDTLVAVTINPYGNVIASKITKPSGDAAFDQAVVAAALTSRYQPQIIACKPTTGQYIFRAEANPY
jgi:TonB family protein